MESAVITGATGTIGIALINKLIRESVRVLILCHPGSKRISCIPRSPLVNILECDLSDFSELDISGFPSYEVFYHLAWAGTFGEERNNMHLQTKNIESTLAAVELAERLGCHTFIGAGSQAEYGRTENKLNAETAVKPDNGYGMAKLCAGQMSRILCEQRKIKHIWFRVLSVYGPHDGSGTMVMSVISKLLNGEIPKLTKGEQQWDYIYCGDAANAFYLAGRFGKHGRVYCLGSGQVKELREYILVIRDEINPKADIELGGIPYAARQVMYLCADISQLKEDTGFIPQTSFEEGIRETVKWCREQLEIERKN